MQLCMGTMVEGALKGTETHVLLVTHIQRERRIYQSYFLFKL
jgi:hypothetical protein